MRSTFYFLTGAFLVGLLWWDSVWNPKDTASELIFNQDHRLTISIGWDVDQQLGNIGVYEADRYIVNYRNEEEYAEMRAKLWEFLENQ